VNYGSPRFARPEQGTFGSRAPAFFAWGIGSLVALVVISLMAWAFEGLEHFARHQDIGMNGIATPSMAWRPTWP
jgi:hypothetical protein